MKQFQINRAYKALDRMAQLQFPVREAYKLYMLAKKIEPIYNFELDREKKLVAKYNGTLTPDGDISFLAPEDKEGFQSEVAELNNMEIDLQFDPVVIAFDMLGNQTVTLVDIACLDGFVVFE